MGDEARRFDAPEEAGGDGTTLFEMVTTWLEDNEWDFSPHPTKQYVSLDYLGEHGNWRIIIDVSESEVERRVLIYSVYPVRVPPARRATAADFVVRASYGMKLANIELDMGDGEVRVKTALDMVGGQLRDDVLERLLLMNVFTANRYLALLLSVAYGGMSAEEAANLAEASVEAHEVTLQ